MGTRIPEIARETVRKRERDLCVRCGGRGTDWHHRRSRRVRDPHSECSCNGVLLCRTCHRWAHEHPADARDAGMILSQWCDLPARIPVRGRLGWMALDCHGQTAAATPPW